MPPTRILVVTHYFPEHGGGVEIVGQHIAAGLQERGYEIEWIASREPTMPTTEAPGARPVPALNVSERWLGIPYPLWGPSAWRAIRESLHRVDIVHVHDSLYLGNVAAVAIAKRLGKPVLLTQHVGYVPYTSSLLRMTMSLANRVVASRVIRAADAVAFCSKTTEGYFTSLMRQDLRAAWIPNGLDVHLYSPMCATERLNVRATFQWPEDRLVFLFVGRFVEKKGLAILKELVATFPDVTWVFAGWGPIDPSQWQAANVQVVGRCSRAQVARLYQAADLLVLPSVGEGFPLVVQESMACGTPVAISRETADAYPGLDAYVWRSEPTVDGFRALLASLIAAPTTIKSQRAATAAFAAREWSWDVCVDHYQRLVDSLLRQARDQ